MADSNDWILSFLTQDAYLWVKHVLESILLPHARVCAFLTACGEPMIEREIPSEVVERQEIRQMLQEAVICLPTNYRQVFQLREVEKLDVKEAAEEFGISVPFVKCDFIGLA